MEVAATRSGTAFRSRKSVRLKDFDYGVAGYYFVTICSHNKVCILGKVDSDSVRLSTLGEIVRDNWLKIADLNVHVILDEYVIMPNHLHGILRFNESTISKQTGCEKHQDSRINLTVPGSLPTIIRSFKSACTKAAQEELGIVRIWQRGYFEHVIRSEVSLLKIRQYICDNPIKWHLDELYVGE